MKEELIKNDEFSLIISSDLDYEELVVYILFNEEQIATVSQENGLDNLEIEILPTFEGKPWKFSYDGFLRAILRAKECLKEDQKIPEE